MQHLLAFCGTLHFWNHTKIKENTEILTNLVTIFHPPFRFLNTLNKSGLILLYILFYSFVDVMGHSFGF